MSQKWADMATAAGLRDLIRRIAIKEINWQRPPSRYGEIITLDTENGKATVRFQGDPVDVPVSASSTPALAVGATVRVSGQRGDRYIDEPILVGGGTSPGGGGGGGGGGGDTTGYATVRVATTWSQAASNADEIDQADIVLDGVNDDQKLTYLAGLAAMQTASSTLRLVFGSGKYVMKGQIISPAGLSLIIEPATPTRLGYETVEFQITTGWDNGDPLFKAGDSTSRLSVTGVKITRADTGLQYSLTDSCNVQLTQVNVIGATRMFFPMAAPSRFLARESILHGSSSSALMRAGYGTDPTGGTCLQFMLRDCDVDNDLGPISSLDDCPDWRIEDNLMSARGISPALQFAQLLPSTVVRPPTYRQILGANRVVTRPTVMNNAPAGCPFFSFNNIRGAIVHDNEFIFINQNPDDGHFLETSDVLAGLTNFSMYNTITDNLFGQVSGPAWDNASDLSADGTLVSATIGLDATCENNTLQNARQVVVDLNGNNQILGTAAFANIADFDAAGDAAAALVAAKAYADGLLTTDATNTFADADITISTTERYVEQIGTMTADRTATLPDGSLLPLGYEVTITDKSGTCGPNLNGLDGPHIFVVGHGTDTIRNPYFPDSSSDVIFQPYDSRTYRWDGTDQWIAINPGARRSYGWLSHPRAIAIPDSIWTPLPWGTIFADNSGTTPSYTAATTIAAGSNGAVLPQSTINVASTTGFSSAGWLELVGPPGTGIGTVIHYTDKTSTTFTGCNASPFAGTSTGTLATGQAVLQAYVSLFGDIPYLSNSIYGVSFSKSAAGWRGLRVASIVAGVQWSFGQASEVPALNMDNQHLQMSMQPAGARTTPDGTGLDGGFIEVYQNSGGVLLSTVDGLCTPIIMSNFAAGA